MISTTACYIYLHGFASGPGSAKAQDLRDRFRTQQIDLLIPDLNQDNFTTLTLSRQIQQVAELLPNSNIPVVLIGSSFGGLTAAWIAQQHLQVQKLILLAPAFQFLDHWLPRLGTEQVRRWQQEKYLSVYHYGEQRSLPLSYHFVEDAAQYREEQLQRSLPTLIVHGQQDEIIPIKASRDYAATRPWVHLIELASDHALIDASDLIWQAIQTFLSTPAQ